MPSRPGPDTARDAAEAGGDASAGRRGGPPGRIARRLAKGLGFLLLGLVAVVILALSVLQTDWGRERVRRFALERVRDALRGEVDVARLGGDLLRGVTLHEVAIRGPGGEPFLTAERVEVSYEATGFLRQEILLGEVLLVEPTLRLVQDTTGAWNLTRILPEPDPQAPPSPWGQVVRIGDVRIRDGHVVVASQADPAAFGPLGSRIDLQSVDGRLGLEIERGRGADLQRIETDDLSFRMAEADLTVRELDATVERTPEGLTVERLLVRTPTTDLSAEGSLREGAEQVVDLSVRAAPLALRDVHAIVERVPADGVLRGGLHVEGPTDSLTARLEGVTLRTPRSAAEAEGRVVLAGAPAFQGRLRVERLDPADARLVVEGYPLDEPLTATIEAGGTSRSTRVQAEIAYPGTRLQVSGTVGLAGQEPAYDLTADVDGLDLSDLLGPEWPSEIDGSARVEGTGRSAAIAASLAETRIRGYRIQAAEFDGALRGERVLVDTLVVRLPRSTFAATGTVALGGSVDLTFSGRGTGVDGLARDAGALPVGSFAVTGTLTGAPGDLAADVRGSADSLVLGGAVADSLEIEASFTGIGGALSGTGSVLARDVLGPGGAELQRVEVVGTFQAGRGDVVLDVRADSLRTAAAHADVRLGGAGTEVVVDSLVMALADSVWSLRDGGRIAYASGAVRFEDAVLSSDGSRLSLAGSFQPDGPLDVRLELDQVPVGQLQRIAGLDPALTGTASGSVTMAGTRDAPVLRGDLQLVDGTAGDLAVARAEGRFSYAARRAELDARVLPARLEGQQGADAGALVVRGVLPVDLAPPEGGARFPDEPLDLVVEANALRLAALEPGDSVTVTGPIDARVEVGGRPSAPRIDGRFALAEWRLGGVAVESLTGTVAYADQELRLDAELVPGTADADTAAGSARGRLAARARVPVDLALTATGPRLLERPMDVVVEGRGLTLRLLEAAVPGVRQASGPLDVDVRVEGTPQAPRWTGRVAVDGGAFEAGGVRYTALTGALRFDNDEVVLDDLRVASPTGPATASGRVALTELTPGEIQARIGARDFTLLDRDEKEVVVDAALDVGGTAEAPVVTGELTVERLVWPLPEGGTDKDVIDLDEATFYVRTASDTTQPREPTPGVWESTRLALDVVVENDAVLRSDRGLIVLAGDVTIVKAPGEEQPSIAGDLQVVRGEYREFGRRFDVTEGRVRFFGTPDLNPALDVTATTTVEDEVNGHDVQVTLEIGGTVQDLALDFSSTPAYDRSEILSLLLFGTPNPGAGQEERFRSTVARVAASRAAAPLQGALAGELGLDLLEIQPGLGTGDAGFRAGKYLAEDVFVTYTQETGPDPESQFGIQYRITDQWTLETQAGGRQFGVDVYYEFDY